MNEQIFLENKYTRWYYSIVNKAIDRSPETTYTESHHIIPESFYINRSRKGPSGWIEGNPNHVNNLVNLSFKEHLLCHKLLIKMTTGKGKAKMYYGLQAMLAKTDPIKNMKMTSRQYESLRKELSCILKDRWTPEEKLKRSKQYSGEGNPFYGKKHNIVNNKRASERLLGKTYNELYGNEIAIELKKKVANSGEKNGFYRKTHSEKTKSQLSLKRKGKTYEELMGKEKAIETKRKQSQQRKGIIPHNKGKTFEELYGKDKAGELRLKIANSGEKNGFYGKQHSIEQRAKKSAEKLATPKKICDHCNKSVDHMNFSRWHGDNCKNKGFKQF